MDGHATIRSWFDAFNRRDLDGMLSLMDPDVELYPLRTGGRRRRYRGHEAVAEWLVELDASLGDYAIHLGDIRALGRTRFMAYGQIAGDGTSFVGLHEVRDGRIMEAQHFLSDVATLSKVGRMRTTT